MKIKRYRKRNDEKPLPLNPICDQIAPIKPLNHEEHEERLDEFEAAISPSILHQISISTTPRTRKLKRKRRNSRETGKGGVWTVNLIDLCLDALES